MKKTFKILGMVFASILISLYLIFLLAPFAINALFDFEKYKPEVQKLVLEKSKLNLDYSKIRVYTTPMLSIGATIEDVNVTLNDNTLLFKTDKIRSGLALPSLLTLTVKTAITTVDNPYINLEIADGKQYKIVKIIEEILNENIKKPKQENEAQNLPIDLNKIKIKVPLIKISNYEVLINDLKTKHNLVLKGKRLNLGYNSKNNRVKVSTLSNLFSDNNKNIDLDIKTLLTIPEFEANQDDTDPEEKIQLPFINIVEIYQKYDLKANIKGRLAILNSNKSKKNFMKGYLNIDNLTLKLSDIQLPQSYLHTKFKSGKISYDSNLYVKNDEKISLDGFLQNGKNPHFKTNIISDRIEFKNLFDLLEGLLNSLNIKNDFASIKAEGYLLANTTIDTDFKKLKSNGSILIKEGSFVSKKLNLGITDIDINLLFDDNALTIENSGAKINGSKVNLTGSIDNSSNTNIKLSTDKLSLPMIYNVFAPKEIKRQYKLNNANLTTKAEIAGKLDSLKVNLSADLANLKLTDNKQTMVLFNNEAKVNFNLDKEKIKGTLINSGFNFNMPKINTKTNIDSITLDIDNKNITINPFDFVYNSLSKINVKGSIENYKTEPDIDLFLDGKISTENINQTLGEEVSSFLDSKGNIPIKVTIKGDSKKQNIKAQIFNNSANHITPINLLPLKGHSSIIHTDIKINGNKIRIKDSGLFKTTGVFNNDLEYNLIGAKKLIDFTALIDNNHINLLRIHLLKEMEASVAIFKQSHFKAKGKINLNGNFDNLTYSGDLKISDLTIPELLLKVKNVDISLFLQTLGINLKEIDLNGSKINTSFKADLKPSKIFKINELNVSSDIIDVDKLNEVSILAMKYVPKSSAPTANTTANAGIPINLDGKFNIKKLTTGEITLNHTKGDLELKNNNLYINKLTTNGFKGSIFGDITMNLISGLMSINLEGKHINADTLLTQAANLKDTLSGNCAFKANVSLKGATYNEQMQSLKGNVWFKVKDGQYGPFAKLENFFLAENIRENPLFKNTIGAVLSPIATIDSTHFEELEGNLSFRNGLANLETITSQGDILCILIKGNLDLLKNEINSNVRVRLASGVSDTLGPLALANPVNLVKNTPGLSIATAKLFTMFTQVVSDSEYNEIPDFSAKHSDTNATKFQIILKGDINKPLKLVKSFKWLNLQSEVDTAEQFSQNYIKEQQELAKQAILNKLQEDYENNNKLKVGVEKVLKMDTTAPKVKEAIVNEVVKNTTTKLEEKRDKIEQAKQEIRDEIEEKTKNAIENKRADFNNKIEEKRSEIRSKLKKKVEQNLQTSPQVEEENQPD